MSAGVDVVAVVNKRDGRLAIWHVVIDPSWPMTRLCGAWVDIVEPSLCAQRYLLPFGGRLPTELAQHESFSAGVFDAAGTREAVIEAIRELDARHQDSPTKAGKARAPISWPRVPESLDWGSLPGPPRGVVEDPLTSETIAVARWLAQLADAWSSVEVLRLSRDYLADGDVTPRPMPVALGD